MGKKRLGGQSIGELDINAMLSYDAKNILKELMSSRSDNLKTKRQLVNDLRSTGKSFMESWGESDQGQTSKLFHIYMLGCGLDVS